MNKTLSVSIAAYNVEKYINECLMPFAQDVFREDLEVLVIDDGGIDDTVKIASKYVEKFPEIFTVVHKENGGWGSTLNYSFRNAKGKYFKQLDGDDYFNSTSLKALIEYLKDVNDDIIYTPFVYFDDKSGKVIKEISLDPKWETKRTFNIEDEIQKLGLSMHMCTFRTEILRDCCLLEHCFYTDVELVIKAFSKAKTISFFDQNIYCYRISGDGQSISLGGFRRHYEEHLKVLLTCADYSKTITDSNIKKAFIKRLREMAGEQYLAFLSLDISLDNKNKLISFNKILKSQYPELYPTNSKIVSLLRNTGFISYKLLAKRIQKMSHK